jgi:hypothetical protein
VDIGDDVSISVRVDNTGETEGVCQLVCKVNGIVMDEKEITLAGGSGESVIFTTTFDKAGEMTVEVNELLGGLFVKAVDEETSSETGIIAEIPTQDTPEEPTSTSGGYWWIVGVIIGACAILIAGIVFYNRRQRDI